MKKGIFVILILMAVVLTACSSSPTGGAIAENEAYVSIPLSDLSTELTKYSYEVNGVSVNYFVGLGSDGEVRTAFDACDVCGGEKGYYQRGDDLVCINCGRVFSIDSLGSSNLGGGCWPSFLSYTIEGDNVLIPEDELIAGAYKF